MKHIINGFFVLLMSFFSTFATAAPDELTSDTRLACEAILCLAGGSGVSECRPSLNRYFGIHKKKLSQTIKARKNFLKLCPTSNDVELSKYINVKENDVKLDNLTDII